MRTQCSYGDFRRRSTQAFLFSTSLLLSLALPLRSQSTVASSLNSVAAPVQAASASAPSASVQTGSNGLIFTGFHGSTLHVHGYIQADDRMFSSDPQGRSFDKFLFRRIRPIFEGTLFHDLDYRFMPDFGQYNPQIQEAYLELKTIPWARLRTGKFKEPVGLEADKSDRDLALAERSLVSDLLPLRYMGAEIRGAVLANSISYAVGYFNGSNDGSNGSFRWLPANEFAGRVFFLPFATTHISALRQLGVGLGGSLAHQHGLLSSLKSVSQTTFFKYSSSTVADGSHARISPQAYYYAGPAGLMAEYAISSADVANHLQHANVKNQAWEVTGSLFVTGEKNGYNGIRPRRNFEPGKGWTRLGAVELVVRYTNLRIGANAFPVFATPTTAAQMAAEHGFGLNWYLNRFVKLTTDLEHTTFRMASRTIPSLHSETVLMSRLQLAF